ncbi:hypothetical protein COU01_02355 [Candidatus Falkowbacteria bacterium CG10_big_fil_rev_8_21_14_0_10_44_15]|uniref:Uncharacterized protein n=1 Tax=Candidatus Falkowbacteria bacterium CG10_big_fil_rev_8_21_14_0_10_44_15 TaxID=1974569 RepID=A0A2H0UZQ9_9BACT|nr:MAG: hypothetical protein COU01_02355 [Candidatus Falkowbacteria bacterium CG10_big_fil_rev_8_21_14_0_10_44_15]
MKSWINVENSYADNAAIIAFAAAARKLGLSVFFDPDFSQLICIASGTDAIEMEKKVKCGVFSRDTPA